MLDNITKLVTSSKSIAVNIAGLLMTIAFIAFMLAIINYIWKRRNGDAGGLEQAGTMLFGSVFALFVMVAVWGITTFIAINLGIGVGGCTSKPSPVPGAEVVDDNCYNSNTSNGNFGNTNGSSVNSGSQQNGGVNINARDNQGRGGAVTCNAAGQCSASVSGTVGGTRINIGGLLFGN